MQNALRAHAQVCAYTFPCTEAKASVIQHAAEEEGMCMGRQHIMTMHVSFDAAGLHFKGGHHPAQGSLVLDVDDESRSFWCSLAGALIVVDCSCLFFAMGGASVGSRA